MLRTTEPTTTQGQSGFTLVEIIATIVLMGVAGLIAVTFLQVTLKDSHKAHTWIESDMEMGSYLEELTTVYVDKVNTTSSGSQFSITDFYNNDVNATYTDNFVSQVAKALGCFDASGAFTTSGCTSSDVVAVTVTEVNGRQVTALFTKSREYNTPFVLH